MRNLKLFLMIATTVLALSCSKKQNNIDEGYLIELENDYNRSISAETGDDEDVFIYDDAFVNDTSTASTAPVSDRAIAYGQNDSTNPVSRFGTSTDTTSRVIATTSQNNVPTVTSANATTTKVNAPLTSFTSKWVDTKDSKVIKDVRLMIANREYKKAQNYINNLNMNNLPSGTDVGHLYQFKGIVNYFLVPVDTEAFSAAIDSFQKAFDMTDVEKFKPLSILWLGMLYERYSSDKVELAQALNLFDEIINKYSDTRFVNDAAFYKTLVLQKLGRIEEAQELIISLETTKYPDTLVYSKWSNDYVALTTLLPKLKA